MGRLTGRMRRRGTNDGVSPLWAVHLMGGGATAARTSARAPNGAPDGDQTEAIARRVAALLAERPEVPRYLNTGAVAEMVGMSEHWVREHAAELGGSRLGDGERGCLRFDPEVVRAAIQRRRLARATSEEPQQRRSGRASAGGVELVEFRDRSTR